MTRKMNGISPAQKAAYLKQSREVMAKYDSFLKDNASFSKALVALSLLSLAAFIASMMKGA
ncbi:hypothetical protein [uncultured Dubosiella sp.]|uniref:hypothetical protein n=1 Tax=uncultured Dubosiella sp. TaxID=1937011 RepID=UPI0025975570|nr:hypothetical protein [uncultured Dubosiella sp.]